MVKYDVLAALAAGYPPPQPAAKYFPWLTHLLPWRASRYAPLRPWLWAIQRSRNSGDKLYPAWGQVGKARKQKYPASPHTVPQAACPLSASSLFRVSWQG